jgi:hypothetical protein
MSRRADSRALFRFALLIVSTVAFAVPAAAQGQQDAETVLLGSGGAVVLVLSLCGIFAIAFSTYTRRTTEQALADIGSVLKSGFIVTTAVLLPFIAGGAVTVMFDDLGVAYLAVFGILGPLLIVPVVGAGLGFLVLARAVSDNWIVATIVITVFAGTIGAGTVVIPTLLIAVVPLMAAGIGAMIQDWRAPSPAEDSSERRKPHPWEHRQP